jgi:hypothetical protein
MLKTCRCNPQTSKKVINTKIFFRTALQLGIYECLSAVLLSLQTPVPNYQDVNLSFLYEMNISATDYAKVGLTSPHDFVKQHCSFMSKVVELELSSPQIREFMGLVNFVL